MKKLRSEPALTFITLFLLGLAPLIAQSLGQSFLINLFSRICIYALAALGLNFILGYGGLVSFGHAAFIGVGAYVMGICSFHFFEESPLLGIIPSNEALIIWPLAMLFSGLFALVIGLISLRTRGVYFIMITLAFAQMLFFLGVSLEPYGGDDGLSLWWGRNQLAGFSLDNRLHFFYVCFSLLVLTTLLVARLIHSPFGQVIQGCKQHESKMRALGYHPLPYQLLAFIIAGALAGLAGALIANLNEFISPSLLHWSHSGEFLAIVILGGMATLAGPILGSAIFFLLEEFLSHYTHYWHLIFGPLLILVVLFSKRGLAGLWLVKEGD